MFRDAAATTANFLGGESFGGGEYMTCAFVNKRLLDFDWFLSELWSTLVICCSANPFV